MEAPVASETPKGKSPSKDGRSYNFVFIKKKICVNSMQHIMSKKQNNKTGQEDLVTRSASRHRFVAFQLDL